MFYIFQCKKLSPPWIILILNIFLNAFVNDIFCIVFLLDWSLLVCRKTTDFFFMLICFLQLCWISSSFVEFVLIFFSVELVRFYTYEIMSSKNRGNFPTSFPIWTPFIYLSCLFALARLPITVLGRSGATEHSCLLSRESFQIFTIE